MAFETDADGRSAEDEVAVNLLGSVRMTRLALRLLRRADDGAVVFVSSALAQTRW
jgi:NAD(P)-dependent dehydrogenase (short-subunit alcohol dehydrogenase family)